MYAAVSVCDFSNVLASQFARSVSSILFEPFIFILPTVASDFSLNVFVNFQRDLLPFVMFCNLVFQCSFCSTAMSSLIFFWHLLTMRFNLRFSFGLLVR